MKKKELQAALETEQQEHARDLRIHSAVVSGYLMQVRDLKELLEEATTEIKDLNGLVQEGSEVVQLQQEVSDQAMELNHILAEEIEAVTSLCEAKEKRLALALSLFESAVARAEKAEARADELKDNPPHVLLHSAPDGEYSGENLEEWAAEQDSGPPEKGMTEHPMAPFTMADEIGTANPGFDLPDGPPPNVEDVHPDDPVLHQHPEARPASVWAETGD